MRQIFEYSKMAFQNILSNKMRSLLTMLGIIIGISAVIVVMSIGSGGQEQMKESFAEFVTGSVEIYVSGDSSTYSDLITQDDIDMISKIPGVAGVTMQEQFGGAAKGTREEIGARIVVGNAAINEVAPSTLEHGRKWNQGDYETAQMVCTVDSSGAKELFGSTNVVGMPVTITSDGKVGTFTIVGVTQSQGMGGMGSNKTAQFVIPISSYYKMAGYEVGSYYSIALIGEDANQSGNLAKQAVTQLELRHNNMGREMYMIFDFSAQLDTVNQSLGIFTTIIAAIAAISLLVGGIGVMNIMLVSVTERTREIGIRKALGAKTYTIMIQFLIESATLTLVGGILGILLGVWGGSGLGGIIGVKAGISSQTVLAIVLFSSVIGIFFGIYPARKAAKLNPIEALRSD